MIKKNSNIVTYQSAKKKKKSQDQIFFGFQRAKAPPTPPIPTTYHTIFPYLFDRLLLSHPKPQKV